LQIFSKTRSRVFFFFFLFLYLDLKLCGGFQLLYFQQIAKCIKGIVGGDISTSYIGGFFRRLFFLPLHLSKSIFLFLLICWLGWRIEGEVSKEMPMFVTFLTFEGNDHNLWSNSILHLDILWLWNLVGIWVYSCKCISMHRKCILFSL
jgi:hypothetical protein